VQCLQQVFDFAAFATLVQEAVKRCPHDVGHRHVEFGCNVRQVAVILLADPYVKHF
jgi:hypothetical protein